MPIKFIEGDIFVNKYNAIALAHGCNCQGVMGSGIAKVFKQKYPKMYKEYRRKCKASPREFNPCDVFLWLNDQPIVFNLATEEEYWKEKATYQYIRGSLENMIHTAHQYNIKSIAMPAIGAGLGRLEWSKVKEIIKEVGKKYHGTLYVYEKYLAGE